MPVLIVRGDRPVHGPYAESWFDEGDRVHRLRLTDEGRAKLEEYLGRYPYPIAMLLTVWPAAYRAARAARYTDEEINSVCVEGVALAFARYNPSRGAAIGTVVMWGIRAAVGNAMRQAARSVSLQFVDPARFHNRPRQAGETPGEDDLFNALSLGTTCGPGTESDEKRLREERIEEIHQHFSTAALTEKERAVLSLRFGLTAEPPKNNVAIARVMEISTERVRQLSENAVRKLRSSVGLDDNWFVTARARVVRCLSSMSNAAATKAELTRRTGVPVWQLREILPQLLKDGLVLRERKRVGANKCSLVYRMRLAEAG